MVDALGEEACGGRETSFAIGLSEHVFTLDSWDIAAVPWDVLSGVLGLLDVFVTFVHLFGSVAGVPWDGVAVVWDEHCYLSILEIIIMKFKYIIFSH